MNRYERYKDSGIPWLGEVPEHWEVKRLKFLTNKIVDGAHFTPTYVNEGVPFLRVTDIQEKNIDMEKIKYIPLEEHQELIKRCNPQKGDLLLSKNGTIGISKKIDWNWEFSIFVSLCLIKFNSLISSNYAKYFFDSNSLQEQIFGLIKKNTVINLHLDKIENFWFVLPSLKEQTAIAHYLDTKLGEIDALIDKQQTLLEKLAEQRTAVITQAVTKGLNPAAPMKNSGVEWLGDVPAHWDIERLKFIASVNKGKMPKELVSENFDDFPTYLSMDYLRNGIATHFVVDRTVPVIDENEILLLWDGANAGEFIKSKKGVISSTIALIKFQDRIYKNFAWYACLVIERILRASTIGMGIPHVNGEELKNSPIVLPPVKEQTAIAEYLDQETSKIDRLCETVNQTIGRLKEYRTALITQAVTGKIKVTDE